jgi:hypothetical protein
VNKVKEKHVAGVEIENDFKPQLLMHDKSDERCEQAAGDSLRDIPPLGGAIR